MDGKLGHDHHVVIDQKGSPNVVSMRSMKDGKGDSQWRIPLAAHYSAYFAGHSLLGDQLQCYLSRGKAIYREEGHPKTAGRMSKPMTFDRALRLAAKYREVTSWLKRWGYLEEAPF